MMTRVTRLTFPLTWWEGHKARGVVEVGSLITQVMNMEID